jgi:hypothetical protein
MDIEEILMLGLAGAIGYFVWKSLQTPTTMPATTPVTVSPTPSNYVPIVTAPSGPSCPIPGTSTTGIVTKSGACFGLYGPTTGPACPSGQSWQQGLYSGPVTINGQSFPGSNIPPGCQPVAIPQ